MKTGLYDALQTLGARRRTDQHRAMLQSEAVVQLSNLVVYQLETHRINTESGLWFTPNNCCNLRLSVKVNASEATRSADAHKVSLVCCLKRRGSEQRELTISSSALKSMPDRQFTTFTHFAHGRKPLAPFRLHMHFRADSSASVTESFAHIVNTSPFAQCTFMPCSFISMPTRKKFDKCFLKTAPNPPVMQDTRRVLNTPPKNQQDSKQRYGSICLKVQ